MRKDFICSQENDISDTFKVNIVKIKFESLIEQYFAHTDSIKRLNEIKEYYQLFSNCYIDDEYMYYRYFRYHFDSDVVIIPINIAKKIMEDFKSYPRILVSMAEKSCKQYANENVNIVGEIANENNWFD
jgi:hypothetical protein